MLKYSTLFVLIFLTASLPAIASSNKSLENKKPGETSLFNMPLEDLLNIRIISAQKKEADWFTTPASMSVLTNEDIRRSGVTSLPDALRLAPGVEVAQINSNAWAISIHGFNNQDSNKLLVLIDGRSIYTPTNAATYWDLHDVMLEDVERIEIIRGPGGTLWGSNAVNGVINIITKNSADTQGTLVSAGAGTLEKEFGALRYGGKLGENAHYRLYTKYFNRDHTPSGTPSDDADDWDSLRGGLRLDWDFSPDDKLMVQTELLNGRINRNSFRLNTKTLESDEPVSHFTNKGWHILTNWDHVFSDRSTLHLRTYYDQYEHLDPTLKDRRKTFDMELQHNILLGKHHAVSWGLSYRYSSDKTDSLKVVVFDPKDDTQQIYSTFFQDEISFLDGHLKLILGIKAEHNSFTHMEYQPNIRLSWMPSTRHTFWAAISRAVRIPSRADRDSTTFIRADPLLITISGDKDFRAETMIAYECGYRFQLRDNLAGDISLFLNDYEHALLVGADPMRINFNPVPHFLLNTPLDNGLKGVSYGTDISLIWNVTESWKLYGGYSYIDIRLQTPDKFGSRGTEEQREGSSPENRFYLRSYLNLPFDLQFDVTLNYVDNLPAYEIHSYTRLDLRLAWKPRPKMEISLVGQNLIDSQHKEYADRSTRPGNEIERSCYVKFVYQF